MAETAAPIKDFASMAIESMQNDPDVTPAPVKVETTSAPTKVEKQSGIPEQLFAKPDKDTKVESTSEVDAITEPVFRDPKNKGGWETLKNKAKDLETKYGEAQRRMAELEAKGKDTTALEEKLAKIEKEHAAAIAERGEYQKLVQQVNIELDPEFRKTYIEGRKGLIAEARAIAEESGLDPKSIETALNLNGKSRVEAIDAAVDGMSAFQQGRLGDVINKLNRLDTEAQSKRGNPEEFLKGREKQESERAAQELESRKAETTRAFREAMREVPKESIMLTKLDGAEFDWWNRDVDGDFKKAEEMWTNGITSKDAARMVILSLAVKRAETAYTDMRGERDAIQTKCDKFEAELNKLYGKGPRITTGDGATQAKGPKGGDFASRVIETARIRQ